MIGLLILLLSIYQPIGCLKMGDFQTEGAVVSLPSEAESGHISASKVKSKVKAWPEIHTWKNKLANYQLECRVAHQGDSTPEKYSVRVLYKEAVLEAMEVTRFDGELTKSITIQSTNDTVHIVRWENWGKTTSGLWKGAIASLPPTTAAPDKTILTAFKIHTWFNVIDGYHLTVYRVTKNSQTFHYFDIYYNFELLQSGVQITRFDDTLLNSVSLTQPRGQLKDQHEIQYKFHDGSCKDRLYSYAQEKAMSSKIHLDISENDCQKYSAYMVWTSVNNIKAINGWLYTKPKESIRTHS